MEWVLSGREKKRSEGPGAFAGKLVRRSHLRAGVPVEEQVRGGQMSSLGVSCVGS